jgi:hypothetical protein
VFQKDEMKYSRCEWETLYAAWEVNSVNGLCFITWHNDEITACLVCNFIQGWSFQIRNLFARLRISLILLSSNASYKSIGVLSRVSPSAIYRGSLKYNLQFCNDKIIWNLFFSFTSWMCTNWLLSTAFCEV